MAEISAADVKALREKTGAGPMECKKALVECGGDFGKAEKLLKEKGLAAVEKRGGRATNEGKVFVKVAGSKAVLLELSSETDFVARNPEFAALGEAIAEKALEKGYTGPNEELSGMVTELATKIRENMGLKRLRLLTAGPNGYLSSYNHMDGQIGVVVRLEADNAAALENPAVKQLAFDLCLHITAFNPLALDRSGVDPAFVSEQEEIFRKQMAGDEKLQGKPEKVLEGILKGKVNKFLADICLLDQGYVKDEKITVKAALEAAGKAAGARLQVAEFAYFKVGQ